LQRDLDIEEIRAFGWIDENDQLHPMFKTPQEGAATTVWAATSPLLEDRGGVYCEDCNIAAPNPPEGSYSGVFPWFAMGIWRRVCGPSVKRSQVTKRYKAFAGPHFGLGPQAVLTEMQA